MKTYILIAWIGLAACYTNYAIGHTSDEKSYYFDDMERAALSGQPDIVVVYYNMYRHHEAFEETSADMDHFITCIELALHRQPLRAKIETLMISMSPDMPGTVCFFWDVRTDELCSYYTRYYDRGVMMNFQCTDANMLEEFIMLKDMRFAVPEKISVECLRANHSPLYNSSENETPLDYPKHLPTVIQKNETLIDEIIDMLSVMIKTDNFTQFDTLKTLNHHLQGP